MKNLQKTLRAAIIQASPVMFNKKATLQKVACQIKAAGHYTRPDILELIVHE